MGARQDAQSRDHLQVVTGGHDAESDYGSEVDDHILERLVTEVEFPPARDVVLGEEVYEEPLTRLASSFPSEGDSRATAEIPVDRLNAAFVPSTHHRIPPPSRSLADELTGKRLTASSWPATTLPDEQLGSVSKESSQPDHRTPLERFRTLPKKPLSVTDIVSPAWCELQYWYNLTKYGKVKATPAMKQGTGVHRTLEEEVHTQVAVDTATREDRFALRLWNIITGLQTLRRDGMTRELEVWGLVEGELVNGVIDQVTTICPDEAKEQEISPDLARPGKAGKQREKVIPLPANQTTMTGFLERPSDEGKIYESARTIYLADIKTRQSKTLPSARGHQLRPVHMQLMMYHQLFSSMANGSVPSDRVFARYRVDPDATFSDGFLAQMAQLNDELTTSSDDDLRMKDALSDGTSPAEAVLAHTTLRSLWSLMLEAFSATAPTVVSHMLTAEYRTPDEGSIIGRHYFAFNQEEFERYVADEMRWWRGERHAKGVDVEEAYKCRICEFAPQCTWRLQKIDDATQRARARRQSKANG